jgi:FkbM family methyltransferase
MSAFDSRLLASMQRLPFEWGAGRRWCINQLRRRGAFPVTGEIFGYRVCLHDDNTSERKFLVQPYVYNRRDFAFLTRHLPATGGGTFVDVGANAGIYAFAVAARASPGTRILCIEPNPRLVARIETNLLQLNDFGAEDKRILIDRRGVDDKAGWARLATDRGLGAARLTNADDGLDIEVATLATILDDHGIAVPDTLKIDIEGLEDRALLPFFESTSRDRWPKAMVVEHCGSDSWRVELIDALVRRGYVRRGRTRNNVLLERAH